MRIWLLDKKMNSDAYENRRFQDEAAKMAIELQMIAPEELEIVISREGQRTILHQGSRRDLADCLLTRLGSGATYFAMAAVRHLESSEILVLNPSRSIEVGKDKLATLQILAANSVPIPKTMLAKFPLDIDVVEREFTYPLIVKTVSGSRGKGVLLCETRTQMEDLADLMEVSIDSKTNLIVQEFVSASKGNDIRVIVVGGRAIGAMLRTAKEGRFKANYSAGGSVELFTPNPAIEWLAVESARAVGLDIAGVDILFDGDSYRVCEVNCAPGFEGFEKATGLNVPREIYQYIRVRLEGAPTS
jgi:RimK family alpha-L-glutamate ligase